jgi:sigma-B regulation protein RsbU (phosphoserine phosphatase)
MVNVVRSFSPFADDDALNEPRFVQTRGPRFNEFNLGWKPHFATAGVRAAIDAKVRSEKLTSWKIEYEPVQPVSTSDKSVHNLTSPFAYIAIILAIVVFFFRKLRGDRMSFRAGLPAGVVCALASILPYLLSTTHSTVEQLASIFFVPLFFILSFMMLYAVSESMMRDTSGDYLKTFEALQHRHVLFKPVGESLWYGALFGALAFGLATVVLYKFGATAKYYTTRLLDENQHHLSYMPALSLLGGMVSNVIFGEITFRLFAISFFKRYFRSFWMPVMLSAVVAAAAKMHLIWLHPLGMMLAVNFVISFLFSFAYARYDFLASVIAALTVQALFWGMSLLYIPGLHSAVQASLLLGVPVLFLIGGEVVRRYGSETINVHELEPDYVQRLAERERMTRELEIARQVQASFLPREKPVVKGLDIASLCVPAQEVGGDYYDFIPFSPTRLGVLIGDVSGKGISAAFYMTLTKGIVKTLVREGLSPAEVLIRANQHFYENAERGIFVSLVFGIFDLQKREFTFARAGHNPVVIVSSNGNSLQTISPPGLALGLEPGDLFARKMVEKTVPISPGDLFVFYTDGFTEAMNHGKEEFGEPRFSNLINGSAKETSEVVIDRLKTEVKTFSGHVPQHDDMTAIVVKVL